MFTEENKLIAILRPHQNSSFSRDAIFFNIGKENSESKQDLICFKKMWDKFAISRSMPGVKGCLFSPPAVYADGVYSGPVMHLLY